MSHPLRGAVEWMRWWVDQADCECVDGHDCGLPERRAECLAAEKALTAGADAADLTLDEVLGKAIENESQEALVLMCGVVLGEALTAAWPEDIQDQAVEQFEDLAEALGYEGASGSVFALLAGMSLRSRRDEAEDAEGESRE